MNTSDLLVVFTTKSRSFCHSVTIAIDEAEKACQDSSAVSSIPRLIRRKSSSSVFMELSIYLLSKP